jgi:hypothetical protein
VIEHDSTRICGILHIVPLFGYVEANMYIRIPLGAGRIETGKGIARVKTVPPSTTSTPETEYFGGTL